MIRSAEEDHSDRDEDEEKKVEELPEMEPSEERFQMRPRSE
jgi:hypothetical protein